MEINEEKILNAKPDGLWDKYGRWYPSEYEKCECCTLIRQPSRSWPYSLLKHCQTKKHRKNLIAKLKKKKKKRIRRK